MIRNQQELFIVFIINIPPSLQRVIVRSPRFKNERHSAIVAFTVDLRRETFEALHKHDGKSIRGIKRHICKEELTIAYDALSKFSFFIYNVGGVGGNYGVPPGLP